MDRKTSLNYILSTANAQASRDVAPPFMLGDKIDMSRPQPIKPHAACGSTSRPSMMPASRLDAMPNHVLAIVAYHLVVDDRGLGGHPSAIIPLLLSNRKIYDKISFAANPQLYNNLFRATFDYAALNRRYKWMVKHYPAMAGRGTSRFDLFSDPKSWAEEYKARWITSKRMSRVVARGLNFMPEPSDEADFQEDAWVVWFLVTENDGRNAIFLNDRCNFKPWIMLFHRIDAIRSAQVPGYPIACAEKSLATWSGLLSGIDPCEEGVESEVDEKIFALRPFVFACAKYDIFIAPWNQRRLPLTDAKQKTASVDPPLQAPAVPYKRFGQSWRRTPPSYTLCCILDFLRLIDRHARRAGLNPGSSTFSQASAENAAPGLFTVNHIMPSIYHDWEWQRSTICQDPNTSVGLPALTFRGELQGFWRGKFLFYDFDMYRQILGGNMRGVYTGTFVEQAAEMEFKETVIKVKKDDVGGSGPVLCAGFVDLQDDGDDERAKVESGYGYELCTDENAPDEPGWTKEILVSGRVRTSWGWGSIRGRVRAWDGLVSLCVSWSSHIMGRWLWRGYLETGGYLVGRWRDTFTPEQLRGYEGTFGMIRAGDIFYPPHFPKRIEDSLGVNDQRPVPPGNAPSGPSLPSSILLARPRALAPTSTSEKSTNMEDLRLPPIRSYPFPDSDQDDERAPVQKRFKPSTDTGARANGDGSPPHRLQYDPLRLNQTEIKSGDGLARMKIYERTRESNLRGGTGNGGDATQA